MACAAPRRRNFRPFLISKIHHASDNLFIFIRAFSISSSGTRSNWHCTPVLLALTSTASGDTIGNRPIFWQLTQNFMINDQVGIAGVVCNLISQGDLYFCSAHGKINMPAEINVLFADNHNVGVVW